MFERSKETQEGYGSPLSLRTLLEGSKDGLGPRLEAKYLH